MNNALFTSDVTLIVWLFAMLVVAHIAGAAAEVFGSRVFLFIRYATALVALFVLYMHS